MTRGQVILTVSGWIVSLILIPCLFALARVILNMRDRLTRIEEFNGFISKFLLKNAVLEFHNNPNPHTDEIIEKIQDDEPLTPDEMNELKGKLERVAESSPDKRKQLRAARTLELLRFVEEFGDSISERSKTRNALFAE